MSYNNISILPLISLEQQIIEHDKQIQFSEKSPQSLHGFLNNSFPFFIQFYILTVNY